MAATVEELLAKHSFLRLNDHGKVHCSITKHDVPANVAAIGAHLASAKFVKASQWYRIDYSKYEPWIIAHKRDPRKLFCRLTGKALNRIPEEV